MSAIYVSKEEFDNFLVKNNCKEQFYKNLKADGWSAYEIENEYFEKHSYTMYIRSAFVWEDTTEGFVFWYNLHLKWLQFCNKLCEESEI